MKVPRRLTGWYLASGLAILAAAGPALAEEALPRRTGLEGSRVGYAQAVHASRDATFGSNNVLWGHQLDLAPQWQPLDWLSVGALVRLGQAIAAVGREPWRDVVTSDLLLTAASPGVTVPVVGVRVGGAVHLLLPTSQTSQSATLQAGVGPELEPTRDFPVFHRLTLGYSARWVFTVYRYPCLDVTCTQWTRNSWALLAHGPSLVIELTRSLSLSAKLLWRSAFLRAPPWTTYEANPAPSSERARLWYSASIDYRLAEALSLGVGITNDDFAVLPEAGRYFDGLETIAVLLRLTLWPASWFE